MPIVTMRQLLEAGIHFGHQTRRWNPKMDRYIFGQRNGIYIIDLQKTMRQIRKAYAIVRDAVADGGTVLFVGTKKQARESVTREAERCGMFYMNNRWLGGTLTNWQTIRNSIKTLLDLEEMETSGKIEAYSKKEGITMRKHRARLDKNLCGIKKMSTPPKVMFVVDTKKENIAVKEAERLGIPCIGIVDTNADPDSVQIPIPGNDDALRAVGLFCSIIADAVLEGRMLAGKKESDEINEQTFAPKETPAAEAPVAEAKADDAVEAPADTEEPVPAEAAATESTEETPDAE